MNEIKYTTDGKKVAVLGNLNSQEKIVQEIFIINDSEIPSGENFIVKTLHDSPAISWKQKEIDSIDKLYNQRKEELKKYEDQHRLVCNEFRKKIEYISSACKNIDPSVFKILADYITGKIKYIVVTQYGIELIEMSKFNEMYEGQLRLISFFGKDNGSFTYAVGDYYDYSGGNKKFIPCETREEAITVIHGLLLGKKSYSKSDIKIANELSIALDADTLDKYFQAELDCLTKNRKDYLSNIEKCDLQIQEFNNLKQNKCQ